LDYATTLIPLRLLHHVSRIPHVYCVWFVYRFILLDYTALIWVWIRFVAFGYARYRCCQLVTFTLDVAVACHVTVWTRLRLRSHVWLRFRCVGYYGCTHTGDCPVLPFVRFIYRLRWFYVYFVTFTLRSFVHVSARITLLRYICCCPLPRYRAFPLRFALRFTLYVYLTFTLLPVSVTRLHLHLYRCGVYVAVLLPLLLRVVVVVTLLRYVVDLRYVRCWFCCCWFIVDYVTFYVCYVALLYSRYAGFCVGLLPRCGFDYAVTGYIGLPFGFLFQLRSPHRIAALFVAIAVPFVYVYVCTVYTRFLPRLHLPHTGSFCLRVVPGFTTHVYRVYVHVDFDAFGYVRCVTTRLDFTIA